MSNYSEWVVVLHYERGNSETLVFENKEEAMKRLEVIVFRNEDCINCSIYRQNKPVKKVVKELVPLKEMDFADLEF